MDNESLGNSGKLGRSRGVRELVPAVALRDLSRKELWQRLRACERGSARQVA